MEIFLCGKTCPSNLNINSRTYPKYHSDLSFEIDVTYFQTIAKIEHHAAIKFFVKKALEIPTETVNLIGQSAPSKTIQDGFHKLEYRCNKCGIVEGDYTEK